MNINLYSEEEILNGCYRGDRRYQEILYRKYSKKMYGICLSYAGNRDLAKDMLQDGFIKILKNIKNYKSKGNLEGWIRKVIVNTSIDILRQRQSLNKRIKDDALENVGYADNNLLPAIQLKGLLKFIDKLPEGARVIFNLIAIEGYTHKQIAEELNISEGTSKSQYSRAKGLLRHWLENIYER